VYLILENKEIFNHKEISDHELTLSMLECHRLGLNECPKIVIVQHRKFAFVDSRYIQMVTIFWEYTIHPIFPLIRYRIKRSFEIMFQCLIYVLEIWKLANVDIGAIPSWKDIGKKK